MNNRFDYDIYIFLCDNKREVGLCCGSKKHDDDFNNLKKLLKQYKAQLKYQVKLNQTGCLGRCVHGPNVVIFPHNIPVAFEF